MAFSNRFNFSSDQSNELLDYAKAQSQDDRRSLVNPFDNLASDAAVSPALVQERVARWNAQSESANLAFRLHAFEKAMNDSAFVLMLIDGNDDGYIFREDYFEKDYIEGGKQAAIDVYNSVNRFLALHKPELAQLPIMVKIVASASGLACALSKAGVLSPSKAQDHVLGFISSFNQAGSLFDFILVVDEKDGAHRKIKGTFRQFVENPCCKHVIFGGCRNDGYMQMLKEYAQAPATVDKVTLLTSLTVGAQFFSLPFRKITMKSLFRSQLVSETWALGLPLSQASEKWAAFGHQPVEWRSLCNELVERQGVQNLLNFKLAIRQSIQLGFGENTIVTTNENYRVDMPLPEPKVSDWESLMHKAVVLEMRFCDAWHLSGSCFANCGRLHGSLSEGEKLVKRHLLRKKWCLMKGLCRDAKCLHGHHCSCHEPRECDFPAEMHNVDLSSVRICKIT